MSIGRLAISIVVAAFICVAGRPAWPSGAMFLESAEIPGNPEFVIFGSVKDEKGKYVDGAIVKVKVAEHMLEFSAETNVIGRYRTPDIGRAIKDLGYDVDLSLITVIVESPHYEVVQRQYRGKYRQNKGAIEMNFRVKKLAG
ncbi:MAG TPA: hypothetical protein VFS52_07385 [Steroidobacteraceae bacterium]|jgi:hypothetical protein|nr:hypothetical protein [Steroidobacteraceae bacterium]